MKFTMVIRTSRIRHLAYSGLLSLLISYSCLGNSEIPYEILNQQSRPTVQQIQSLLKKWKPVPLQDEVDLPKDPNKMRPDLQYNFPIWFQALIQGAPRMIAVFESAFPGATWAFIGRDMAILADLFEAFYDSIGQSDRVVRIGMSRGTLEKMNGELAVRFLKSHGLEIQDGMHPFILIDAVSRGGGTQGRFLLNSVYSKLHEGNQLKSLPWTSTELLPYFNFIGLRVYTTSIPSRDVSKLESWLKEVQQIYKNQTRPIHFDKINILTYFDGNLDQKVIGVNEAGYTHWTGAWHGSYGAPITLSDGKVFAQIGQAESQDVRRAVALFQCHVIQTVQTGEWFLSRVQEEASKLGFQFPLVRPHLVLGQKVNQLRVILSEVKTLNDLTNFIVQLKERELSSSELNRIRPKLIEKVKSISENQNISNLISLLKVQNESPIIFLDKAHFLRNLEIQILSLRESLGFKGLLSVLTQTYLSQYEIHHHPWARSISHQLSKSPLVLGNLLEIVDSTEKAEELLRSLPQKIQRPQKEVLAMKLDHLLKYEPSMEVLESFYRFLVKNNFDHTEKRMREVLFMRKFRSIQSVPEFFQSLDFALSHFSSLDSESLIRDQLDLFFTFSPNVHEINRLISHVHPDSRLHYEIGLRAFRQLNSRKDYKSLTKPTQTKEPIPEKSAYQNERAELKKRCPKNSAWRLLVRKLSFFRK